MAARVGAEACTALAADSPCTYPTACLGDTQGQVCSLFPDFQGFCTALVVELQHMDNKPCSGNEPYRSKSARFQLVTLSVRDTSSHVFSVTGSLGSSEPTNHRRILTNSLQ
jgi:hypothetical protein